MSKKVNILKKKYSFEPESNQRPKDVWSWYTTVLRSTNWAIEGGYQFYVFKIFKLSCFRYFVLRKDGTRQIWFLNAKELYLERRGIIFYDNKMLFIHSWRQRHFKLYVIGVFNFYTVNGFDFKLFKNNFSNIIKVANVSRFDVRNFLNCILNLFILSNELNVD